VKNEKDPIVFLFIRVDFTPYEQGWSPSWTRVGHGPPGILKTYLIFG